MGLDGTPQPSSLFSLLDRVAERWLIRRGRLIDIQPREETLVGVGPHGYTFGKPLPDYPAEGPTVADPEYWKPWRAVDDV